MYVDLESIFFLWKTKLTKFHTATEVDSHETPSRPTKGSQADRRIDIQPAEDEEGSNVLFLRILATFDNFLSSRPRWRILCEARCVRSISTESQTHQWNIFGHGRSRCSYRCNNEPYASIETSSAIANDASNEIGGGAVANGREVWVEKTSTCWVQRCVSGRIEKGTRISIQELCSSFVYL